MNEPTNKKLWFRAKTFGWGWFPISWEGWVVTLLYVLAIVPTALAIDRRQHSVSDFLFNFGIYFVIITIFFLIICYSRGERPRWSWGQK